MTVALGRGTGRQFGSGWVSGGARLVPAEPVRPRAALRAARARRAAPARAGDLPAGLDDRPDALRDESPDGAVDGRAHDAAGRAVLPVGHPAVAPGHDRGAASGAPGRRDRARRRPHPVLDPPRLPPGAVALAAPRRPPLVGDARLAGRLAPALDRHRRHPRALVRTALRPRVRSAGDLRVPGLRVVPRGVHPRQRAVEYEDARLGGGDAALPPLAPRRAPGGQELRGAPALARPSLRHRASPARSLARRVRHRRPPRARGILATARVAAPARAPQAVAGLGPGGRGAAMNSHAPILRPRRAPGATSRRTAAPAERAPPPDRRRFRSPSDRSPRTRR